MKDFTERERDVLVCLLTGLNNIEIAEKLVVTLSTVKAHLTSIYKKLSVRDRGQAIVECVRLYMEGDEFFENIFKRNKSQ